MAGCDWEACQLEVKNVDEINCVSGKRTKIGLILIGLSGVYPCVLVTCGS